MSNVHVTVKARVLTDISRPVTRKICISMKLLQCGMTGWVDSISLISLLRQYFLLENKAAVFEDISVKCQHEGAETDEIHLKHWTADLATKNLQLKELGQVKEPEQEKETKKPVIINTPHEADVKGFCKHCFRHVVKKNRDKKVTWSIEYQHCKEHRQDILDNMMSEEKKEYMAQGAERHSLNRFRG